MLEANRFDTIKKQIAEAAATKVTDLSIAKIVDLVTSLKILAAEIDRIRSVPQVSGGRSHIKPVVLGADGKPVAPPPLSQQFAAERREQFAFDRYDVLMSLDPAEWRVFALRWGLSPPPGGWDNHEAILGVMHGLRVALGRPLSLLDRHVSATYMTSRGIALPQGVTLKDGELIDARPDQQDPA
jgi:hypothetical protein